MTKAHRSAALVLPIVLLSGCVTELKVPPLDLTSNQPITGVTYSLPYAQFDIILTRSLSDCTDKGFSIDTVLQADPVYRPDPSKTFVLDYRDLSSPMKTSSLRVELHDNKMIKKLGAKASDQTGPVIINTLTAFAKIAATVSGLPGGGVMRGKPGLHCTDATMADLAKVKSLTDRSDSARTALERGTERYKEMVTSLVLIGKVDPAMANRLITEGQAVLKLKESNTKAANDLADHMKKLTHVDKFRWPTDPEEYATTRNAPPSIGAKWFTSVTTNLFPVTLELRDSSGIGIRTVAPTPPATPNNNVIPKDMTGTPEAGIRFRPPVAGELVVSACTEFGPAKDCISDPKKNVKVNRFDSIPQLGRVYLLPFRNGIFQDNTLDAEFASDGRLTSFDYADKASTALVASDTLLKAVSTLHTGITDARAAGPAAKLAALKAQTDILEQQAKLKKAQVALAPPKVEAEVEAAAIFETNTTLKKAEIANIEATEALQKARASVTQ